MTRPPEERRSTLQPRGAARATRRLSPPVGWALVLPVALALVLVLALVPGFGTPTGLRALPSLALLVTLLVWQRARLARERRHRQHAQLEARTDALTGLPNRRGLDEQLHAALRQQPLGAPLSVIVFDLDHFKRVNDTCGHATGDAVLASAARELKRVLRDGDVFGRWGGEEFLVVLPGAPRTAAVAVAERLRWHLRTHVLAGARAVTASFGVAAWRAEDTLGTLLARADARMYRAKSLGRDRTVGADEQDPPFCAARPSAFPEARHDFRVNN